MYTSQTNTRFDARKNVELDVNWQQILRIGWEVVQVNVHVSSTESRTKS